MVYKYILIFFCTLYSNNMCVWGVNRWVDIDILKQSLVFQMYDDSYGLKDITSIPVVYLLSFHFDVI